MHILFWITHPTRQSGALSKRDSRLTVQFVTDVAKLLEKYEKHDMAANKYKTEQLPMTAF